MGLVINNSTEEKLISAENLYNMGQMPEMMTHWYSIRKQYPKNYLLAYRMGDFYEFFYDDAVNVSKLLGLTLTYRGSGPSRHPLAGLPHKATQHFKSLVKLGQTVIIVEQLEDPKKATGKIVKRGVVRILSPGTVVDDSLLESTSSNYICSVYREKKNYGVAFLDFSSGEFKVAEFYGPEASQLLWSYLARFSPVECVLPPEIHADLMFMGQLKDNISTILKEQAQFSFIPQNAKDTLCSLFNLKSLASFGIENNPLAIGAAGGLISFILETQKEDRLSNITRIQYLRDDQTLFLDYNTQKNLELLRNQSNGDTYGTLFQVLDHAQTPMGTRLLKTWILQPLISKADIEQRLEYTTFFVNTFDKRGDVRSLLGEMGDLTRLITRINYSSTANARDLLAIKRGLQIINKIRSIFTERNTEAIKSLIDQLEDFTDLIQRIEAAIHEQPPITITEGGIIKDGYNAEVDEYRDILHNGKDWIIRFEEQEKKRLGLATGLKVQYNRVLGYFIQLTDNAFKSITLPDDYSQRQSLKNALRYDTPRLKEMETKILSAEENVMDLEYRLFQEIREEVQQFTLAIQTNAEIIAQLDVLSTFAEVAQNNHYCRPSIETHQRIVIKQGRHPVVETLNQKEAFVPNDTLMDTDSEQILIITGPNWSGKSTYLRQTALIVLMAQMGCYVPAASAEIGIVDRIFTRIGASDDLTRGQSTFMLEMTETAQILNYATPRSLIIIDELGRGTGTVDGESIAQAVITYLHDVKVKTLFSTHFHKLINIKLPRIHNYHFKIIEKPETRKLVFLRQLTDGGTDKSYGIHVAMMAGLPAKVTDQAFCLLEAALNGNGAINATEIGKMMTENSVNCTQTPEIAQKTQLQTDEKSKSLPMVNKGKKSVQTSLFPIQRYDDSELVILLRSADLDNMTPIQAFEFLAKLKEKIRAEKK